MFAFLKSLFRSKGPATVGLTAHPLELAPPKSIREERNFLRVKRLQEALALETDSKRAASLKDEIDRRIRFGR